MLLLPILTNLLIFSVSFSPSRWNHDEDTGTAWMSPESGSGSSSKLKNVFYYIVFSVVQQTLLSKANYREQIHVIKGAVGWGHIAPECLRVRFCALGTKLSTFWLKGQDASHCFGEILKPIFSQVDEVHERIARSSSDSNSREVCGVHQMWCNSHRHIRCIRTAQI